jgi:sulfate transport system permease protein
MAAVVFGALREGVGAFWSQISNPEALNAIKLSILLGLGATALNTVFGLGIAWVLVRDDFSGRRYLNGLVDLPFAVSPVIAGLMLILLFGRNGWFIPWTDALGLKLVFAWPGMLLATTFVSLPFVVREVMPVLSQIGLEQELAAYTMGASPWRTFWSVTFPSLRWGLLYGISLTLARSFGEFGAVLVVSGGVSGLTETSTLYIFRSLDDRNYVGAYSVALLLAIISFAILIGMEFVKRWREKTG